MTVIPITFRSMHTYVCIACIPLYSTTVIHICLHFAFWSLYEECIYMYVLNLFYVETKPFSAVLLHIIHYSSEENDLGQSYS